MKNANTFAAGFEALTNPQHILGGGSPWVDLNGNATSTDDPLKTEGTDDDVDTGNLTTNGDSGGPMG